MTRKVAFIASSPHGGSTLLELALCAHSACTGIGESYQLANPTSVHLEVFSAETCACGSKISDCPFWGQLNETMVRKTGLSASERYEAIYSRFGDLFGEDQVVVDSSKTVQAMKAAAATHGSDIRVIHLVRDVRAWTVSMQDNYRRNAGYKFMELVKRRGLKGIVRWLMKSRFYDAHNWYRTQRNIEKTARSLNLKYLRVSYDALCLDSADTLQKIADFLGIQYEPGMASLENIKSHNVYGNRMRLQDSKRKQILYDYRWFYKNDWALPYMLLPHVARYNKKLICENMGIERWEK